MRTLTLKAVVCLLTALIKKVRDLPSSPVIQQIQQAASSLVDTITAASAIPVRTITLGGRLPGCKYVLRHQKGRGGRLTWNFTVVA